MTYWNRFSKPREQETPTKSPIAYMATQKTRHSWYKSLTLLRGCFVGQLKNSYKWYMPVISLQFNPMLSWLKAWGYIRPMLRLLSSKAHEHKDVWKPSKPYCVGIHWSSRWVLSDEYPFARVSIIFRIFASFHIGQISHQQHKGQRKFPWLYINELNCLLCGSIPTLYWQVDNWLSKNDSKVVIEFHLT